MRKTAVAALEGELSTGGGRAAWDREVLYGSLVRWGAGSVIPSWRRTLVGQARRTALRAAARSFDFVDPWRTSSARRRLRDAAQIERVIVDPTVEVLYGNIHYPVTSPPRATVWSTQGIPAGRVGTNAVQSARTHERFGLRADAVHCWSRLGFAGLVERTRIDEAMVHVIPPIIYVDVPEPAERKDDEVLVIFVGGEARLKGVISLIEAFRGLGPGVRLEVISAEVAPDDLPAQVKWLHALPRQAVLAKMASADALALPSEAESFGGVVVEALAAGLPAVVAAGTVPEELAGPAGVPCQPNDVASIRAAITTLAGDAAARRHLSHVAVERYRSTFSPEAVGPVFERVIDAAFDRFSAR